MYKERCYDKSFMKDEYPEAQEEKNMNYVFDMEMCCPTQMNVCPPIVECPKERCCHRYICHEVPHIQPCNTKIINHHIYRHTYTPTYTCCEENEYSDIYDPKCC